MYGAHSLEQVSHSVSRIQELITAMPEKKEELEPLFVSWPPCGNPTAGMLCMVYTRHYCMSGNHPAAASLQTYYQELKRENNRLYNTHLYQEGRKRIENIESVPARFDGRFTDNERV